MTLQILVRGRLYFFREKKVCFDFAVVMCSIGVPDIPKNFAKRSEVKKKVFFATPIFTVGKLINFA